MIQNNSNNNAKMVTKEQIKKAEKIALATIMKPEIKEIFIRLRDK